MQNVQEMLISITTDGDKHELETLSIELSEELSLLPINSVEPVRAGEVPEGARGLEALALGKLLVEFVPEAAKAVVNTIRSWLQRTVARSIELTIDGDSITLTKATVQDQERLLNLFIEKHLTS